jgi:hypothetical protein
VRERKEWKEWKEWKDEDERTKRKEWKEKTSVPGIKFSNGVAKSCAI